MDRQQIISKITSDEDKLLISKMFDKIDFMNKRNSIEYTDFLDMRQRQLLEKVLKEIRFNNYIATGGFKSAERTVLIFYPEKLEELFNKGFFDYNTILNVVKIKLPNELKGIYKHRDYLGAIIKVGIKREKVGDINVYKDGADLIVLKDAVKYILEGLQKLTRFSKSEFENIKLEELNIQEPKLQILNIIVPSMRIDSILSEIIRTSRAKALEIIKEEKVFINHEIVAKGSKEVKNSDMITVRGKGRFKVNGIINNTKKGNLILEIEKYI